MPTPVALLLHMHQPDYRDPESGEPVMPWVRLHASRGYTDVARAALAHGARFTLNVVPSLLDQLLQYSDGGSDRWERLSLKRAEDLEPDEAEFVSRQFVAGHPEMRATSGRYQALAKRVQGGETLATSGDLRDLQVWSNLAWMGFSAAADPLVIELRAKDEGFTHDELLALMALQRSLVCGVIDLWRKLPSVSCTPYFHPILPLLVDFDHARRSLPDLPPSGTPDGVSFRHPEDALRQLRDGRARVEEVLGRAPQGLWPSEGALSPESAELAASAGFRWAATDQALLERSERDGPPDLGRPWRLACGLDVLFRNTDLSDRIGFRYQHLPGDAACADLLGGLPDGGGPVPVILDGENPWEAYPDSGELFLNTLFASGRTIDLDSAAGWQPGGHIGRLHTGSWVDGNLHIWAGDPADRAGWRLLAEARGAWEEEGRPEAAWPHIAAAEGSDWFWWFGPEFQTPVGDLFDDLFRSHLRAAWRALGRSPPPNLDVPVAVAAAAQRPVGPVSPPVNPSRPPPGAWSGADPIPVSRGGSMAGPSAVVRGGAVGSDGQTLFLRLDLDPGRTEPPPGSRLVLDIEDVCRVELAWAGLAGGPVSVPVSAVDGVLDPAAAEGARCAAWSEAIVLALPLAHPRTAVRYRIRRVGPGGLLAAVPEAGWLVAAVSPGTSGAPTEG